MKIWQKFLAVGLIIFCGCSVTIGTVNLNQGGDNANPKTDLAVTKPTTVDTKADVPISAIPK